MAFAAVQPREALKEAQQQDLAHEADLMAPGLVSQKVSGLAEAQAPVSPLRQIFHPTSLQQ